MENDIFENLEFLREDVARIRAYMYVINDKMIQDIINRETLQMYRTLEEVERQAHALHN